MNKQLFTLMILLVASLQTTAQIQFQKKLGQSIIYGVRQTSDGGYVAVGIKSGIATGWDIFLFKTNMDGDTLWTKTIVNPGNDYGEDVQELAGGGYVITGSYSFNGTGSDNRPILIETDASGNILWAKTYGANSSALSYSSVEQTSDGGFIIGGSLFEYGTGYADMSLIKTDATGDTLWAKIYGSSVHDACYSASQTSDGGYILVGGSQSFGTGTENVILVKTDSTGNALWLKAYGSNIFDIGYHVKQTMDGGYIIAGFNGITFNDTDALLIKTDVNGDTLWTKRYGGTENDKFYCVDQTSDGGFIAVGYAMSFSTSWNGYVVRTNAMGDTLWTKRFVYPSASNIYDVRQTSDGGFILGGDVLVKTDANGNSGCLEVPTNTPVNPGLIVVNSSLPSVNSPLMAMNAHTLTVSGGATITTHCTNVGFHEVTLGKTLSIAPNPTSGQFTISTGSEIINGIIRVHNLVGEIIFEKQVSNSTKSEIDLRNVSPGTYYLNLSDENKNYCEKLFIVND